MIRKLTYISEQVFESKDYITSLVNEKDNNSPFATKINGKPSGKAHDNPAKINK